MKNEKLKNKNGKWKKNENQRMEHEQCKVNN